MAVAGARAVQRNDRLADDTRRSRRRAAGGTSPTSGSALRRRVERPRDQRHRRPLRVEQQRAHARAADTRGHAGHARPPAAAKAGGRSAWLAAAAAAAVRSVQVGRQHAVEPARDAPRGSSPPSPSARPPGQAGDHAGHRGAGLRAGAARAPPPAAAARRVSARGARARPAPPPAPARCRRPAARPPTA